MDAWLVLAVESPQVVYHWRLQAEQRMREVGRGALTDEQVCVLVCPCVVVFVAAIVQTWVLNEVCCQVEAHVHAG
jgi:pantothenate kinase-related protein Tda10